MTDAPLPAHSLAEAFLYVMVTPCSACGNGSLKAGIANRSSRPGADVTVTIPATCSKCKSTVELTFGLSELPETDPTFPATVNDSTDPSRIIDLAQWLTLARMILEAASKETDKQQARILGMEAAQCLEEALKFYDEDNDLPEPSAFYIAASRVRFEQQPQLFSRQRLVNQRAKLPTMGVMRTRVAAAPKKKKWWFW